MLNAYYVVETVPDIPAPTIIPPAIIPGGPPRIIKATPAPVVKALELPATATSLDFEFLKFFSSYSSNSNLSLVY